MLRKELLIFSRKSERVIKKIDKPVDIKVFVTPSCPYSPIVVRAAHRFAIENQNIRAQMIESMEFDELTEKYKVMGVPKTIINDSMQFDGTLNDELFAQKVSDSVVNEELELYAVLRSAEYV